MSGHPAGSVSPRVRVLSATAVDRADPRDPQSVNAIGPGSRAIDRRLFPDPDRDPVTKTLRPPSPGTRRFADYDPSLRNVWGSVVCGQRRSCFSGGIQ